jgi:hypothetical protein
MQTSSIPVVSTYLHAINRVGKHCSGLMRTDMQAMRVLRRCLS